HDAARMGVSDRRADVAYNGQRMRQWPGAARLQYLVQPSTVEQLHGVEARLALMIDVVHVDHVGMRELLRALKLAAKRTRAGAPRQRGSDLERHVAIGQREAGAISIQCLINRAHAAAAEQRLKLIALPQQRADTDLM